MSGIKDFLEAVQNDPKLLEKLQLKTEFDEFKEKYQVERASPLKCPACSQWGQTGGSLWIHKTEKDIFVCRKCKLVWKVECLTLPTQELIIKMKEIQKA